jgi:hypothetical protein
MHLQTTHLQDPLIALQPEADELEEEEEEEGTPCSKQNPHVGTLYYLSL